MHSLKNILKVCKPEVGIGYIPPLHHENKFYCKDVIYLYYILFKLNFNKLTTVIML